MMRTRRFLLTCILLSVCGQAAAEAPPAPAATAAPDRSQIPPAGQPPSLRLPAQRRFQLSNGLEVRLVEYRRLPIVALELVIDAGAARDPQRLPGLASLTAAMVTEGTKRRTATQISDASGFIGAELAAGAGFDVARVTGLSLSRHLRPLLELLGDVVIDPIFPAADLARVQDQRRLMLVEQRDEPSTVASKILASHFWAGHPYGHWPMGTEASVKAIRRRDLVQFHDENWRPGNAVLVVVGDVGEEELRRTLEQELGRWRRAQKRPVPLLPATTVHRQRAVLVEKGEVPQSYLLMGMPGLARSNPDYFAMEVALQILGGGSSSRLFRNLREKQGYTYGIWAYSEARRLGGNTIIAGSVEIAATGKALKALFGELRALRRLQVSSEELSDAKGALVLSLPAEFATAAGIAAKVAEEAIHGLPDDYWNRYAAEIDKVSAADVRRVAQRYLDPSRLTTVMVSDVKAVKPQLRGLALGPVESRRVPSSGVR